MAKIRIDQLLVEKGLAESRSLAQRLVMAGQVRINGQVAAKASQKASQEDEITVDHGPRFVSRGGEKLLGALEAFDFDPKGMVCADVGASTGGFTDCLLQHGAAFVYAIDVGKGILHWKMRKHTQVEVMEGINARYVDSLPQRIDLVTIDASFISLKVLLPVIKNWFGEDGGKVIALIKPQFEAGRELVKKGKGVIRDPEVHKQVVTDVLAFVELEGYGILNLAASPLKGPKGNTEFLALLEYPQSQNSNWQTLLDPLFQEPTN